MADLRKLGKGMTGALAQAKQMATAEKPMVNRLDMNFKDVTKRVPELTEAANLLAKGKITASQYDAMVARLKPVTPYSFVPAPATIEDAMKALTANKKPMFGKSKDMTAGEQADLRLDIPAYKDHGVWVNSIHRKDQPTVYGSTSSVKNATMIGSPDKALKVAQGGPKAPFAVIRGDWNPMSEEAAVAKAQEYLDHPEWKQVGYDPERHGYFYDRASMEPVHGAEEVIQIGPLVLAKKPTYGKKSEEKYSHGGVLHMADAGKVSRGITGALTKAKEMAQAKKASESKIADVLESQQAPMTRPQGTGLPLMPRDNGMYTLREQKDLPRMPMVDKARAEGKSPKYNERMQDLLDSPKARKKVDNLINKGKDLNVQEWYGTEPLRQVALNAGRTPEQFESMLAQFASASQRNPVDKQNQMGSYLYHLSETGQLPENSLLLTNKLKKALKEDPSLAQGRQLVELPTGYGSLAQGDIFNRAVMIGQGDIAGALPPNKKLGTFYENLLGNVKPVTVDVNALRGPIIEQGDPRWLTSKLVEKDETGKIINSYKPREMYNSGEMSMREAQQRPGFWEAAPSGSEYAGFEELWQRGAKRHGVEPAEAQALGWYGSADVTALKTKPENYVDNLERLIKRTAEQTGKSPTEVMNDMVTGKGFLRKDGGAVNSKESPEDMARFHKRFAMHKALGGRVSSRPVKKMAEGGRASIFDKPVQRMSKGGSSDEPTAREIAEQLGKLAMDQSKKEYESYKKPRAATDIGNRGILAPALGLPVDMINMGLGGVDALTGMMGKPTRLSSEKPFAGSEHIKDLMNKYGVTSGEDRPMTETALSLFSPTGMIKGAQKTADLAKKAPEALNTVRGGLETMSANAQRPFRPATLTMEAVAPDLGQKGGDKFKDLVTKRMISGEGAPVSMERMGGRKTEKTLGQGLYENFAGQQETNPMVGITIPRAGNLSTNKRLIADIGTAGQELGQEMVAAHKFTPLMFKNPKDATAMMIGGSERLTKGQIQSLADMLPGMIVTHSPKNNSMFVAPFEGDALDYKKAAQAANEILGKGAKVQFGKADSTKDIMFRGDYEKMGARPPSAESTEMRNRLKKAEERIVRGPSVSQSGRQSQPSTLTSTVR
jgi:hypothetical protein